MIGSRNLDLITCGLYVERRFVSLYTAAIRFSEKGLLWGKVGSWRSNWNMLISIIYSSMQLADAAPQYEPTLVGNWVLVGLAVIGMGISVAVGVKALIARPATKEAVERKEFEENKLILTSTIAENKLILNSAIAENKQLLTNNTVEINKLAGKIVDYATRSELHKFRDELNEIVEKLERYSRARNHKLAEKVNQLAISMEVLHRNIAAEMNTFVDKLVDKLEKTQAIVLELKSTVEVILLKPKPYINEIIETK